MRRIVRAATVALAASALVSLPMRRSHAQDVAVGDRPAVATNDKAAAEILARLVTVDIDAVSLQRAVEIIGSTAAVRVSFNKIMLDAYPALVTMHVRKTALGTVFERLLAGTDLKIVGVPDNQLAIVKDKSLSSSVAPGTIDGTITDARTQQPLRGVSVTLDDSVATVRTDGAGRYRFASVVVGSHRVSARFVGYARQTKLVTLTEDHAVTEDFVLERSVNTLDQVVVTATGEQRYRELGHVVTKINADSLVKEAPITSMSELLTGRVPGLQVFNSSGGVAGGEVALQIRGNTTTALDPQPIVIVDGVRYKNTNFDGTQEDRRPFRALPRSPLNDLNVNDIESVEVVKGPSASTLYGPDAANGVIVVTTKRGQAGKPQWHIYAFPDLSTLNIGSGARDQSLQSLQGWGHNPVSLAPYNGQCTLFAQAARQCVLDSIVAMPLAADDPNASIIARQRPQWHSGGSVSGGNSGLLYFFSGNYDSQTGALRLSPDAEAVLKSQLGVKTLSDAIRNPNTQQTISLRSNVSSQVNTKTNVTLTADYTQVAQRAMDVSTFLNQNTLQGAPPGADSTTIARFRNNQLQSNAFLQSTTMGVRRLTATLGVTAQPFSWLGADANFGTDLDNTTDQAIRQAGSLNTSDGGEAHDNYRANVNRNAHLGATATFHQGSWGFRTSIGSDYSYTNLDGMNTDGITLAPGSNDISTASSQTISRLWNETASLGAYAEEVVSLHDRLFVTGSLRLDGSTSFGDAYSPHPYPKVGISWVISDEPFLSGLRNHGLDELRLRSSYGIASRYPTSSMKLGTVSPNNTLVEGVTQSVFNRTSLANPLLKPERGKEAEYGVDMSLVSVIHVGLTRYVRRTNDMLLQESAPFGFLGGWTNIGDVSVKGYEATLGVKAFESNRASLDLTFTYANNTNKVLRLGSSLDEVKNLNGSIVAGYPINAAFGTTTIGYADTATNGGLFQPNDGYIVTASEVVSSPQHYLGALIAPRTYTFTPVLSLLGSRLRVSALIDGQAGGVEINPIAAVCVVNKTCRAAFEQATPLLVQAKGLAINAGDRVVTSNFTRWRELSVSGDLPLSLRERMHLSRASASFQIRNLALWTPSSAPDVESIPGFGTTAVNGAVAGSGPGAWGIPQPRTWTIRFDIAP